MTTVGLGKNLLRNVKSPWSFATKPTTAQLLKSRPVAITTRKYASFPPTQYGSPIHSVDGYTRFQHNQKIPFYKSTRFLLFMGTGTVMFGGYYVTHLERVPISGRTRFMDITPRQEEGNKNANPLLLKRILTRISNF